MVPCQVPVAIKVHEHTSKFCMKYLWNWRQTETGGFSWLVMMWESSNQVTVNECCSMKKSNLEAVSIQVLRSSCNEHLEWIFIYHIVSKWLHKQWWFISQRLAHFIWKLGNWVSRKVKCSVCVMLPWKNGHWCGWNTWDKRAAACEEAGPWWWDCCQFIVSQVTENTTMKALVKKLSLWKEGKQ